MKNATKIIIVILLIANSIFIYATVMQKNSKQDNQVALKVYSFEGESGEIRISNGVIVISQGKQIIYGGKLQYIGDKQENIKSYTKTIYQTNQNSKQVIMTNSVAVEGDSEGMTFPDEFLLNKDIGGLSGENLFTEEGLNSLKENMYFSLDGLTEDGRWFKYHVKLQVEELMS
ncbi:MAG: hypothetical protein GX295_01590 [Syntrophomonadaceae bacterium]|nr:hypothetical protein [Syntrophomonadaceae bacterium]